MNEIEKTLVGLINRIKPYQIEEYNAKTANELTKKIVEIATKEEKKALVNNVKGVFLGKQKELSFLTKHGILSKDGLIGPINFENEMYNFNSYLKLGWLYVCAFERLGKDAKVFLETLIDLIESDGMENCLWQPIEIINHYTSEFVGEMIENFSQTGDPIISPTDKEKTSVH